MKTDDLLYHLFVFILNILGIFSQEESDKLLLLFLYSLFCGFFLIGPAGIIPRIAEALLLLLIFPRQ